jgi:hypothetical protein
MSTTEPVPTPRVHDLFICHASADKDHFVTVLARKLQERGLTIWYDEFSLRVGDSIRRAIEEGIRSSDAGLVVLSPHFFSREWPQRELDALISLEISGKKRVLPIWLNIDGEAIARFSPLLADRKAIVATSDLDSLVQEIEEALPGAYIPDDLVDKEIASRLTMTREGTRYVTAVSLLNLSRVAALSKSHQDFYDSLSDDVPDDEREQLFDDWKAKAYNDLNIPRAIYDDNLDGFPRGHIRGIERQIRSWCRGTLGPQESVDLMFYLDEEIDADQYYILFGLPNRRLSGSQMERLCDACPQIGARRLPGHKDIADVDALFATSFRKHINRLVRRDPDDQ